MSREPTDTSTVWVQAVTALFSEGKFEEANALIEHVTARGHRLLSLAPLQAIARAELGDVEGARAILAAAEAAVVQLGPAREDLQSLVSQAASWLPGGKNSRQRREELRHAAEGRLPGRLAAQASTQGRNRK